jgi:Spy/CpxP family protein refolding chaperone
MTNRIVLTALLVAATTVGGAQGNPNRPGRRGGGAAQPRPDSVMQNRAALEGQVRDRLGQMARRQLGLNDAQADKLRQTNEKFADRRRTLMEQERDIRMSLRDEMISGDSTRQKQVGDLLDRMVKSQRQRIELMESEQKELATFLTPMQRARYFGLEEQLRRRVEQMRAEGGEGGRMGPGGPGGPGGLGGRGRMRPNGPPPDGDGMGGPPPGGGAPGDPNRRPLPRKLPPEIQ